MLRSSLLFDGVFGCLSKLNNLHSIVDDILSYDIIRDEIYDNV